MGSHLLLYQEAISPRSCALYVGSATALPLLKCSPASITSSILCIPSVPSSIGMLAREWKRENSPKHAKISLRWRRTTKRSALRQPKEKEKKRVMAMSSESLFLFELQFYELCLLFYPCALI